VARSQPPMDSLLLWRTHRLAAAAASRREVFCSHRGACAGVQVGARDQAELEAVHAVQVRRTAAIAARLVRARVGPDA